MGCRPGLDLMLLWLWHRSAAVTLIRPPNWEPPCAVGVAPKRQKKKKEKIDKEKERDKESKITNNFEVLYLALHEVHPWIL